MIISAFHWLLLITAPMYVLFGGPTQFYDLILAIIIMIPVHWSFINSECIISYFHKKADDCGYTLGSRKTIEDISVFGSDVPAGIVSAATLLAGLYMTMYLRYSVPLYAIINILPRLFKHNDIVSFVVPFMGAYFLRTNQYGVPAFVFIILASCIIKHKDQNSCIVGTHVEDPLVQSKNV